MRAPRAAWLAAAIGWSSAAARAQPTAAPEGPPLVVFHADPVDATAVRARTALAQAAERLGAALVDLSPAPEPAPEAPLHLRRAIEAYHDFHYPDALASADAGVAEATRTGAAGLSATDLSDLLIYRALAYTEQGDAARAWDDFVRAAALDPSRKLDPVRFPPRVVESFGRAAKSVLSTPPATLVVEAPDGCEVRVDGRDTSGQRAITVMRGEHYLRVMCAGYERYGAAVLVAAERHQVAPALRARRPAGPAEARALARERGIRRVVWAALGGRRPLLTLQLYAGDAARPRTAAAVGLSGERAVPAIGSALERLVAPPVAPVVVEKAPPTPWYRRPWLWGVAGAVVASAILVPFVIDTDAPGGFDLHPSGALPP
jgi:tetratricopeptide (TPR) repeat protein